MTDKYFTYRPLLDLIGFTEGTDEGDGYNETLDYGAYTGDDVTLIGMTLAGIDRLQTEMLHHPENKGNSSAIGRYQIVRTTLRKIRKKLHLGDDVLFNEGMQDRMACFLLGGRGIDRYLEGRMTENALINNLAKEWASLPTTRDKGYYSGQNARVTSARVRTALAEVNKRWADGHDHSDATLPPPVVQPPDNDYGLIRQVWFWFINLWR